mgnify:CR=1 FL=1
MEGTTNESIRRPLDRTMVPQRKNLMNAGPLPRKRTPKFAKTLTFEEKKLNEFEEIGSSIFDIKAKSLSSEKKVEVVNSLIANMKLFVSNAGNKSIAAKGCLDILTSIIRDASEDDDMSLLLDVCEKAYEDSCFDLGRESKTELFYQDLCELNNSFSNLGASLALDPYSDDEFESQTGPFIG